MQYQEVRRLVLGRVRSVYVGKCYGYARARQTVTLTLTPSSRNKVVVGELVSN